MEFIQRALNNSGMNYDAETMTFTSGKFTGIKFIDKSPEVGDFCVYGNGLLLCVVSPDFSGGWGINGYYVGFDGMSSSLFDDLNSCCVIPVELSKELIIDWFNKHTFTYMAYTYVKRITEIKYPEYIEYLRTDICSYCGQPIADGECYEVNGKTICENCYNSLYRRCDRCGEVFLIDNNTEETLCHNCRKREFILPYHRYSPPLEFYGSNKNNSVPYLGVELEVDEGGESDRTVKQLMKMINPKDKMFIYCSHDSSLHDGFEIITQPATLKYHTSIKGIYETMFEYLLNKGYLSHDTATCGIHVHFNRDFYSDDEELYTTRLLYLVDKFWDDIVRFSRRNQRRMDRYSKKVDCAPVEYYKRSNKSGLHDYHYYAINLSNQNTIEFRMFKGSLNINTFMATLQFVHNCIIAAKKKNAEEIQRMEFEELITGRACKNYWKNRKGRNNTEE